MSILSEWFSPEMMHDGNSVVGVSTINQRGEKVLQGTAEVAQPTTVYAFTGQGPQEQGMGMDLYNSSPAAHAVWDSADAHLIPGPYLHPMVLYSRGDLGGSPN
jgi:hypothetical protein